MGIVLNPLTGQFDFTGSSAAPSVGDYKVEKVTLNSTDISNKYIVLAEAPSSKPITRLVVIEGIEQEYSVDFEVTNDDAGKRLSWNGLGLESILADGDRLVVIYT